MQKLVKQIDKDVGEFESRVESALVDITHSIIFFILCEFVVLLFLFVNIVIGATLVYVLLNRVGVL